MAFSSLADRNNGSVMPPPVDSERLLFVAMVAAALVIGLATASDYGASVDEFNVEDYGPKALAWYTSGFTDRSQFEVEDTLLWYYGPWFQMLTAFVQSFDLGDRFTVRHATTFLVGLGGLASLLPIGRLVAGRWIGLSALTLCLLTGYLYGNLFFAPIDVPFLAAMTWATLAILVMSRQVLPSWRATVAVGLTTGLAIATRTGGIITHVYLIGALACCAAEFCVANGRLTRLYSLQLAARYFATAIIAAATATALWPWLQLGNPFTQFMIAYRHFVAVPMTFEFPHWGEAAQTDALPFLYIPEQLGARLPDVFLLLLAVAVVAGVVSLPKFVRDILAAFHAGGRAGWRALASSSARRRGILVVAAAVILPVGFQIFHRIPIYDGIRHVLFVIPMLAILAGIAFRMLLPLLQRFKLLFAMVAGLAVGNGIATLTKLHPLEYVAMNTLAGGSKGAYGRFEMDYWAVAATEALRRLEFRLEFERPADGPNRKPPGILICIPWREWEVGSLLPPGWRIEDDPEKVDFVIETERSHCAADLGLHLIDEVRRVDRPFAWTYARPRGMSLR